MSPLLITLLALACFLLGFAAAVFICRAVLTHVKTTVTHHHRLRVDVHHVIPAEPPDPTESWKLT